MREDCNMQMHFIAALRQRYSQCVILFWLAPEV
jgi:hypothetical protein